MKNDGNKMGISPRSRRPAGKKDGKKAWPASSTSAKSPSKYTIVRTPQDIKKLELVRDLLHNTYPGRSLKTDSEVYRILPDEYRNAVERTQELDHQVDELKAKLVQLEDLRSLICRILEHCKGKK